MIVAVDASSIFFFSHTAQKDFVHRLKQAEKLESRNTQTSRVESKKRLEYATVFLVCQYDFTIFQQTDPSPS